MSSNLPERYHPVQVTLHWLIAALVLAAFVVGKVLSRLPNDDAKLLPLALHMALGIVTLLVIVIRFITRLKLPRPAHATTGSALLDWLGKAVHHALYLLVFLMAASGVALSAQAGLASIVFGGSGGPLPDSFYTFTARALHGLIAPALLLLVLLHIGAALYHQLVLKDHLMARMGYGRRKGQP